MLILAVAPHARAILGSEIGEISLAAWSPPSFAIRHHLDPEGGTVQLRSLSHPHGRR